MKKEMHMSDIFPCMAIISGATSLPLLDATDIADTILYIVSQSPTFTCVMSW